jgi:hypothetical protein
VESINRRITVQVNLGKKQDPVSKITRVKKELGEWPQVNRKS